MQKDDFGYILEYLPYGLVGEKDRRPSAIIITDSFSLLLVILKPNVTVEAGQRVYIGEGKRDQVHHIVGRIPIDKLSDKGVEELRTILEKMVKENENKFVELLNRLGQVNVRLHAIELIPGFGKKTTQKFLEERKNKPFESYEDINKRAQLTFDIVKSIEDRIIEEIKGSDKYHIFT